MIFAVASLTLLVQAVPSGDPDPALRDAARRALAAVEADSVEHARRRLDAALDADPGDRLAAFELATLERLAYDYPGAEALYRAILADGDLDEAVEVHAALGLGRARAQVWDAAGAEDWIQRAVAAAGELGLAAAEAEGLMALAPFHARARSPAAGLALLERARARIPAGDTVLRARELCGRAQLLVRLSDPAAPDLAAEGEALARAAGSRRTEAACVTARAQHLERRGRANEMLTALWAAAGIQRDARDWAGYAASRQWAGYMWVRVGHFGPALRALRDAVEAGRRSRNHSALAWARLALADLALTLDDPVSALLQAREARPLLEDARDLWGLAFVRAIEADAAASAGFLDEASRAYEETMEVARGRNPPMLLELTRKLGGTARRAGRLEEARRHFATADSLAGRLGMVPAWEADRPYEMGTLELAAGRFEEAEDHFRRLLEEVEPDQHYLRFDAQARLAEVRARAGDLDGADRALTAAVEELDGFWGSLEDRQLRVSVLHSRKRDWDPDLGLARVVAALVEGGRVERAFELSEALRARTLLEARTRRSALADSAGETTSAPGSLRSPGTTTADAAVSRIPPSTAVLSFVTDRGGDATVAFVATPAGLDARLLPPADSLAADVGRFASLLRSGAGAEALGRRLGEAVVDPLLPLLPPGTRRLLIAADGVLHRLPFDALVLDDRSRLLEHFVVTLVPSASVALSADPGRRDAPGGVLALGDARFQAVDPGGEVEGSAVRALLTVERRGRPALAPLPGSGAEARVAASFSGEGVALLGADASEAALKDADLAGTGVLHLATHALVEERSLLRTALVLSAGEGEDGLLYPEEISGLRLAGGVVVLSACRTADGAVLAGEGLQGLTAPFLEAGARAVVASYWPLDDREAPRFMKRFYAGVAAGSDVAGALAGAKREALRKGWSPGLWAGLAVVGDGDTRLPLQRPFPWLAAGAGLVVATLAFYGLRTVKARGSALDRSPEGSRAVTHQR